MGQFYQAMFEQCPVGIAFHRAICYGSQRDYLFVAVNPAFAAFTGLTADVVAGKTITAVLNDNQADWLKEYQNALAIGEKEYQCYIQPLNRWLQIKIASPGSDCFVTMVRDLPQDTADKAQSQFMAKMSDEILTPLNSIIGMSDLLLETELSDLQKEYVETFKKAGATLLSLANDILDIAKIDAGNFRLEDNLFNLPELVANITEQMAVGAAQKNLSVSSFVDLELPEWVSGDKKRLTQILHNLLDNAVKFTDRGQVSLQVRAKNELTIHNSTNEIELLFTVTDTGKGIPAEALGRIFAEFYQVGSPYTRQCQGSGLGLSISKKLVQLMGGDIWVDSAVNRGSTFYFTVWLKNPDNPFSRQKTNPLRILLVEDCLENQLLIKQYMKSTPYSLDIAANGQEAIEKALSSRYDLILMDIQMPVKDGYAATREIRAWEKSNRKQPVPIVALTACSRAEEVRKMLANGFDAHLAKPIRKSTLLNYVGQFVTPAEEMLLSLG